MARLVSDKDAENVKYEKYVFQPITNRDDYIFLLIVY